MGKGWCEAIICLTLADVMVKHFYYISHSFVIFGKANTLVPDALLLWRVAIFHSFVFSPLWQAGFNIAPLSQHTHMHSIPVPVQFRPQLCWYPAPAGIYILDWTCWSKWPCFDCSRGPDLCHTVPASTQRSQTVTHDIVSYSVNILRSAT